MNKATVTTKLNQPYQLVNVQPTFSGEAGPGKNFIYLIFQEQTNNQLLHPLYLGKTNKLFRRLANHATLKRHQETHKTPAYVYIAGSVDTEYSDRALNDLKVRFRQEGYLPENDVPKKVKIQTIINEWSLKWSSITRDAKKFQTLVASQAPITQEDIINFFKKKRFSSPATTYINRELVKNYNEVTGEAVVDLKVGEVDAKRIQTILKELRYWVHKPQTSRYIFVLTNLTKKQIITEKIGKIPLPLNENDLKSLLNQIKRNPNKVTGDRVLVKSSVVPVNKLVKKQFSQNLVSNSLYTRNDLRNLFINNPKIDNQTMGVLDKLIKSFVPRTGVFTRKLTEKEATLMDSPEIQPYFKVVKGNVFLVESFINSNSRT